MHMVGYLQPKFFVESRVITWIIEALLFIAVLLGMRKVRASGGASSGDRAIGIGTWCFGTLAVFEALIFFALLVGRGGAVRHLYELLAIDSSTTLDAERSRFGLLMVFSLMVALAWPAIVMGMKGNRRARSLSWAATVMFSFLLWCILFVLCWPLALIALVLYPIVWLLLLPFRLVGIAIGGALALVWCTVTLPLLVFRRLAGR
jgi:hypothetical protein